MNGPSVKYFMWGYQPHFQSSANRSTHELFAALLPELDASLFLVGVKVREQESRLPICVEPDHCSIQPDAFSSIEQDFEAAVRDDERSQMMYSNPVAAERVHTRLKMESLARAIEACCTKAPGQCGRVFMASDPTDLECYAVSCVLSFDRATYESQHAFCDDVVDRMPVERSLVQAVARELLICCRDAILEDDAGANLCVVKATTEELLRRGGQRFLKAIGWRVFGIDNLDSVHRLCDSMHAVSAMHYEGSTAAGRFVLYGRDADTDATDGVQFIEAVSLRESRRLRKLLELTRQGYSLLISADGVIGLTNNVEQQRIAIDVPGDRHWRLFVDGMVVCEFKYGTPGLPRATLDQQEFGELCTRVLPADVDAGELWSAAKACMSQPHGTTMVVSSRAVSESARLSRQSTTIKSRRLTPEQVMAVSSIDGALLFDQTGMCHAIGVILDGLATEEGDPARGARYNSAIRYLSLNNDGCLILIVSEDGDVTLLPQLRDRIARQNVHEAIETLLRVSNETPFRQRVYAEALQELDKLRFYLSSDQCDQLNKIVGGTERRLDEEGRTIRVCRPKFVATPEMNDSYFLDE